MTDVGLSAKDIAAALGINARTVVRYRGLPPLPPEGEQEDCLTCVDIEWLVKAGEIPEVVARRLGFASVDSLRFHAARHGRAHLIKEPAA